MAVNGPDKQPWLTAMGEEFSSLIQHSVSTLVDQPPDANILGGMWVFSKKRDEHNRVARFKARWVVFGNHQIAGIDVHNTYASVAKVDSLRILLGLAASKSLHVTQFDVKTAFLNSDMKDAVYCKQVTGLFILNIIIRYGSSTSHYTGRGKLLGAENSISARPLLNWVWFPSTLTTQCMFTRVNWVFCQYIYM